jgi:hypothetical protein
MEPSAMSTSLSASGTASSSRCGIRPIFARVEVDPEAGTITWPEGQDMAPEPLYAEARQHPVPAARVAH